MPTKKITRLAFQDNNPNRISVFLNGEFAFGVYQDLILQFGLRVGGTLSEADIQQIQEADTYLAAKAAAIQYVAHKARTRRQVEARLARGGYAAEVVEQVIARLQELGYLDDTAYAHRFVSGRFRNRGYGPERLRNDLLRRGIHRAVANEALEEELKTDDLLEAAREQAEKRWTRLSTEPDLRKRRKKLYDFLLRRGFTADTVRQVVERVARPGT